MPRRDGRPEAIRPTDSRRSDVVVIRGVVPPDERTVVDGIPVTTPPRTLFDLAAVLRPRELERAFGELEVRRLRDPLSVADLIERHPGHRGLRTLRQVLGSARPEVTRNAFEEAFVALLDSHGLPRGRMNATLRVRDRFFEPDCLWDAERLLVELDGRGVHGTRLAFEQDRRRDRLLLAEGWRTLRITWRQLRDEPDAAAADLRAALRTAYP